MAESRWAWGRLWASMSCIHCVPWRPCAFVWKVPSFLFFHRRTSFFGWGTKSPNLLLQRLSAITKFNAHQISCYTVLHSSRYYTCTKSSDLKHVISYRTVSLPISYANQWQRWLYAKGIHSSRFTLILSTKIPWFYVWKGLFWFCLIYSTYTIF